jgi:hypothetical protein
MTRVRSTSRPAPSVARTSARFATTRSGEEAITRHVERFVTAEEMEPHRLTGVPRREQVVGFWFQEEVAVLGRKQSARRSGIVIGSRESDHDKPHAASRERLDKAFERTHPESANPHSPRVMLPPTAQGVLDPALVGSRTVLRQRLDLVERA